MDFKEVFQIWKKVLLSPGEEFFVAEREKPSATLGTALVWMILASIVAALLGLLQSLLFASTMSGLGQFMAVLPPELQGELGPGPTEGAPGGPFASLSYIIIGPIGFLIGVGIFHLIAKVLGGRGQYGRYAYLMAAFGAPITIVTAVLSLVPVAGACAGVPLMIYYFVLAYFATKVEYGLSQGRAIVAVVLPVLAVIFLVACAAIAGAVAIASLFA